MQYSRHAYETHAYLSACFALTLSKYTLSKYTLSKYTLILTNCQALLNSVVSGTDHRIHIIKETFESCRLRAQASLLERLDP